MTTIPILPCITAPGESKNFLEAINLVSLGAVDLASSLVSLNNNPNRPQQPPPSSQQKNIEIGFKAARFFAALLRFMIQGPPDVLQGAIRYPCKNIIAFAHTMLATSNDAPDITACAKAIKSEVVHKAVAGLVARRRASLKRFNVVGGMGVLYERPPLGEIEAKGLEGGKTVRLLREVVGVFQDRLDEWIGKEEEEEEEEWQPRERAWQSMEKVWNGEDDVSDGYASDWSFVWLTQQP